MNWLAVIGFVALFSLILSVILLMLQMRLHRRPEGLPDGDYVVTIVSTHETPQGVATMFKIDEPKAFRGHTVTIVKGKTEGEG